MPLLQYGQFTIEWQFQPDAKLKRHYVTVERGRPVLLRGPVVDEAALVKALKERRIAGAALDVYEFEPRLAPGLAELDNAVLTAHTASATRSSRDGMALKAAENLLAMMSPVL